MPSGAVTEQLSISFLFPAVLAQVDKYAEIEYSMVADPTIVKSSIGLSLKGEFYNIEKKQETPFPAAVFSLPTEDKKMLYLGVSAFTANSAAFVYHTAGALSLYITDDMIPQSSPFRLNTRTFGGFIPQVTIAKSFPCLLMKLLVKTAETPIVTVESNNATIQATSTVTAYAIQANGTLSPLFVLNMARHKLFFTVIFLKKCQLFHTPVNKHKGGHVCLPHTNMLG
uniref:Bactericidal permeability-increasing protein n=1 Tax=Hippocampus comes TaxID=109280 RepID=A0A3Q2Y9T9_HIPCM